MHDSSGEAAAVRRAALMVTGGMAVIGLIDNLVPAIAAEAGLWQFHATRSLMALPVLGLVCLALGWRLRPRRWRGVAARSLVQAASMLFYFGALAVLPIGQVVAGLFTAPIFVLLISALVLRERIGPGQVAAVALGFAGILVILRPWAEGLSPVALAPVAAGALYAVSAIATRAWCEGESAATLLAGFFATIGAAALIGLGVVALLPEAWRGAAPEAAVFLVRPFEPLPGPGFWLATVAQAMGTLVSVALITRAYQTAPASRVSVFEYALLVFAALWAAVLWGQRVTAQDVAGMAMIAAAGVIIARGPAPRLPQPEPGT